MNEKRLLRATHAASALAAAALLAACGGGGSSTAVSTTGAFKVSGVAATGAALADAAIAVQCASGSGSATSAADGSYSVAIDAGAQPCVVTATSSDGSLELHSLVAGSGTADATANVTPLTELLVARLAGTDPKSFVQAFTPTTTISADAVTQAQTALLQTLQAAGVDTSAVGDALAGTITAGSGSGYDGVLDALAVAIANAGTSLAEITTAIATSKDDGSATATSTLATALAPAASDCPGLKSGALRVMDFDAQSIDRAVVDVAAMTVTVGGAAYHLTANAACDYTLDDAFSTRVLVARSGMSVFVSGSGVNGAVGVALPEQTLDLASLAGTYNRVQYSSTFDAEAGDFGTVTFDAAGHNTTSLNCPAGVGACVTDDAPQGHLAVNAEGGFDYVDEASGTVGARVFGFRNPAGRTVMVGQAVDGTVYVFGSQGALELPAVNRVASFWQFNVNPSAGLGAVTSDANTVTAVDTAAGKVTRRFDSDGHTDTIAFNAPTSGLRYRATNDCQSSAGGAFNCNGVVQMPLGGLVVSVSSTPSRHFVSVSVDKP